MKKTLFAIFLTLLFVSTQFLPRIFAQDYTQWNLPEGAKLRFGKGIIYDIKYSSDGTKFEVWSSSGTWVYDTVTYEELTRLSYEDWRPLSKEWLSPNRRIRVVHGYGSGYGATAFYDVDTGTLLNRVIHNTLPPFTQQLSKRVEPGTGTYASTYSHCTQVVGLTSTYGTAFSPDGKIFAVGGENSTAFYDVNTGQFLRALPITGRIWSFSPDGQKLISLSGHGDDNIHLWNVDTGTLLYTFTINRVM